MREETVRSHIYCDAIGKKKKAGEAFESTLSPECGFNRKGGAEAPHSKMISVVGTIAMDEAGRSGVAL